MLTESQLEVLGEIVVHYGFAAHDRSEEGSVLVTPVKPCAICDGDGCVKCVYVGGTPIAAPVLIPRKGWEETL